MKIDSLREGMVFKRLRTKYRDGIDEFYEIVECGERKINGYAVNNIFLGNLKDKSGVTVDFTTLCNKNEWVHQADAYIEEEKEYVVIRRKLIKFPDRDPIVVETLEKRVEVDEKEEKKESSKKKVFPIPAKEVEVEEEGETDVTAVPSHEYHKYAGVRIDNLEILVNSFMTKQITEATKAPRTAYGEIVRQSWEQFSDMQYSVKEVRARAVRVNNSGRGQADAPLSYQRVIYRLMEGLVWYGNAKHKQALTHWLQKKHWERQNGK